MNIDWYLEFGDLELNVTVDKFTEIILSIIAENVPNRVITANEKDPPWITKEIKVNRQMRSPELKIPTLAKWFISPLVRVIIKICKKHLVLKTNSNINIYNET